MVPPGGIRGGRPRLRGEAKPRVDAVPRAEAATIGKAAPAGEAATRSAPDPAAAKKRVLFLCIGNSCRSQMAEGFARAYGSDVMTPLSAGLSPAPIVAPLTKLTLAE